MTEQDKQYRQNTSMSAFTFYLDDLTKLKVLQRQREDGLTSNKSKGTIAATIRVLLRLYGEGKISLSKEQIEEEYLLTTKKNKRSSL